MSTIQVIHGDLIEASKNGRFDVIAHGCNCFCNMGKGIALQIKQTYPDAYAADLATSKGSRTKLGTVSTAIVGDLHIINAYTQYRFGSGGPHADYNAIRSCLKIIKRRYTGMAIGIPRIGCGLAGGDWNIVANIIIEELDGENVTIMYI